MSGNGFEGGLPVKRIAIAEIGSGDADQNRPCHFCKTLTPRVIMFRKPGDKTWDCLWTCDYCMKVIRNLDFKFKGL